MQDTFTLRQKANVLSKLFDAKCTTEKALQDLSLENILKIPNVTIQDITIITELQKHVKNNKLFTYLGGGENEQKTEKEV